MTAIAIEYRDLRPVPQIASTTTLTMLLIGCAALLLASVIVIVVLSQPRRAPRRARAVGAHSGSNDRNVWHARIDAIVEQHARGAITRAEAFDELAQVARNYASVASGADMRTQTLLELSRRPHSASDQHSLNLLKQTIGALYPPQFADAQADVQARDTSVEQAGEWVSRLVERWRR
ncbi:hypothetical protein [Bifidobacterium sp.]|jgi:hypothetical protein|uniref:hypothetical protein n=1 Tax=Bifidobacterium sp. TaxID=41200 RepID=UPI0025BBD1C0|nr:hypothetical protein [Bifidobacterium sp.]MCH4208669.1 hypothetical protein [Bifidobacterium sp.]MCI1224359.1 hypothetical protein [Bifidobacterium sp.]